MGNVTGVVYQKVRGVTRLVCDPDGTGIASPHSGCYITHAAICIQCNDNEYCLTIRWKAGTSLQNAKKGCIPQNTVELWFRDWQLDGSGQGNEGDDTVDSNTMIYSIVMQNAED